MRKLVTVQTVDSLQPIEGKDRLCLASFKSCGWKVLVNKEEIRVNDKVVYFEVDSAIPAYDTRFSFLIPRFEKVYKTTEGVELHYAVIRTMKMCKQISQGLALPAKDFEAELLPDGYDMTELFHVKNWSELEEETHTRIAAAAGTTPSFKLPSFVPVTDQTRIQADFQNFKDKLKDKPLRGELKADGSSMSVFYVSSELALEEAKGQCFGVCSHHIWLYNKAATRLSYACHRAALEYKKKFPLWRIGINFVKNIFKFDERAIALDSGNQFIKTAYELDLKSVFETVYACTGRSFVYQGELVGPKLNGNRDKYKEYHWLLFDIWDADNSCYLLPCERDMIYERYLAGRVERVATKYRQHKLFSDATTIEDVEKASHVMTNHCNLAEGIVWKSEGRPYIHFKCVDKEYLLNAKS